MARHAYPGFFAIVFTITLSLVSACAFKQDDTAAGSASDTTSSSAPASLAVQLSWDGLAQPYSRSLSEDTRGIWTSQTPAVLPTSIPDSVRIGLALSQGDRAALSHAFIYGWIGQTSDVQTDLSGQVDDSSQPDFQWFKASGLSHLISGNAENSATIEIDLFNSDSKEPFKRINLSVVAPPSQITSTQAKLPDYEKAQGGLNSKLKVLTGVGIKLGLLQVLSIKSTSTWPVNVMVPVKLSGQLTRHLDEIDIQPSYCSYQTSTKSSEDPLTQEITTLPLNEDVPAHFRDMLDAAFAAGGWNITVEPGQTVTVGIYGSGDRAAQVTQGNYQGSSYGSTTVTSGCKSSCGGPGSWMVMQNLGPYWKGEGYPGDSKSCVNAQCVPRIPGYTQEACNECAHWETGNGLAPWDDHRFCWSHLPGNPWGYPVGEGWQVEKTSATVQQGVQSGPVVLNLDLSSAVVSASFHFNGITESAPVRTIPNLFSAQTSQAE